MADNPRKAAGQGGDVTAPNCSSTSPGRAGPVPLAASRAAATADDAVGVTLVAWQVDGETVAFDRTAPVRRPPGPRWGRGTTACAALAFDAGGNERDVALGRHRRPARRSAVCTCPSSTFAKQLKTHITSSKGCQSASEVIS